MIAVAELHDTPLLVHHVHSNCLAKTIRCLGMIDQARKRGLNVLGEFYAYEHGSTQAIADYLAPNLLSNTGMDFSDITVAETEQAQTRESFTELRRTAPTTQIIVHHIKKPDVLLTEEGDLALVRAVPDAFTEVARVEAIAGRTWNHPVLVGDRLFVRNGEEIAAFRLKLSGPST